MKYERNGLMLMNGTHLVQSFGCDVYLSFVALVCIYMFYYFCVLCWCLFLCVLIIFVFVFVSCVVDARDAARQ